MPFCKDCNIEIISTSHYRTNKHKENAREDVQPGIKLIKSAFRNRIVSYQLTSNNNITDVKGYLEDLKCDIIKLLSDLLRAHPCLKVNMELYGIYLLSTTKMEDIKSFNSRYIVVSQSSDLENIFNDFQSTLFKKALDFAESESGWALARISHLELNASRSGGC